MVLVRAAVALLLMIAWPNLALADKRVALVIGNSAYKHTGELANPKNDATDISAALKRHGFQVIDGFDLDKAAFDRKVRDFGAALSGAEVGLFFYAGHGLQVAGQNYLVPVDAELITGSSLDWEMIRLDLVQRTMEREASTNIIFLDACRDNPLARNLARAMGTRSAEIGHGLAATEAGIGTLISFSTQPGNVALDGTGRNSPFAASLVKQISTSNDDLSRVLIAVRNDVIEATRTKQVPWEHSALRGPFYFNITINVSPQPGAPTAPHPGQPQLTQAAGEWSRVDKTSMVELETFLRRHGSSPEADYARARLAELKEQQLTAVKPPVSAPTPEARAKPNAKTVRVRALIDGRSIVTIQNNKLWWHHLDWAAPGRWDGRNEATTVNGSNWYPTWSQKWGPDVRCGDCSSSSFDLSTVGISLGVIPVLEELRVVQARGKTNIKTRPSSANGYLTEVELDDPAIGADFYEVILVFSANGSDRSSGR